ncbi:MAG: hypothetical protein ABSH48_02365 [Verrucomicrobiota bacterium]|jgi:hypothetical protein
MLTLTYAPDGTSSWSAGIVLCNTTRSLSELDVRFNHKRIIQSEAGFGAAAMSLFDQANWQNTLSLKIRRSQDFSANAFPDPEGALAFALQQPASFPTTGCLRIQLQGVTTNVTLYLLNCGLESIQSNYNDLGIAPAFEYTFNGGLISTTSPF